jgi:CxxC motif-containing protein (DUF1111 family)
MRNAKIACLIGLILIGCNDATPQSTEQDPSQEIEIIQSVTALGDPIPGLNTTQLEAFKAGKTAFSSEEDPVLDGFGPIFNEKSCSTCHSLGAIGGSGTQIETRFGRLENGVFDPLAAQGGSLIQVFGVGAIKPNCNFQGEVVPNNANVQAGRRTTALFGLGLVDAVPDWVFLSLAVNQPPNIRGRVNYVQDFFADPPRRVVGKFGWKSQVPSLLQFSADAYLNEMGVTTTSQVGSRLVTEFSHENLPSGLPESCDPKPGVDDPDEEGIQEDVQQFKDFMQLLAPPAREPTTPQVRSGAYIFEQLGCATCHTPVLRTGQSSISALSYKRFRPYSDFLLHDMGTLGDGIGAQGRADLREMRTSPLWGLRFADQKALLHDGRAHSIEEAIRFHDGQARQARDAFKRLSSAEVNNLLAFLKSI